VFLYFFFFFDNGERHLAVSHNRHKKYDHTNIFENVNCKLLCKRL